LNIHVKTKFVVEFCIPENQVKGNWAVYAYCYYKQLEMGEMEQKHG